MPPLTRNDEPVAPESAPLPSASVPVTPVRATLLVPPSESVETRPVLPATIAPVVRIRPWPLASIVDVVDGEVAEAGAGEAVIGGAAGADDVDAGDLVIAGAAAGQGDGEAARAGDGRARAGVGEVEAGDVERGAGADQMLAGLEHRGAGDAALDVDVVVGAELSAAVSAAERAERIGRGAGAGARRGGAVDIPDLAGDA